MGLVRISGADAAATLDGFDAVIDARTPAEFAEDHLPGARNWPSLDDEQRRIVGTRYRQVSAFEARRLGAVMVARNIAAHLEREAQDKPLQWRPLVYCWRGGLRSGTLAWFMERIGFRVHVIDGGYKAFRAAIVEDTGRRVAPLRFEVVCGRTGSGKTRLLQALASRGAQVLDLEALARHRGSVLGGRPGEPQPTQKAFETAVWDTLRRFDPARPVFVESESQRIGALRVPAPLIERLRAQPQCIVVEMPDDARVRLLLEDYAFFRDDAEGFNRLLDGLVELRGRETIQRWQAMARAGRWAEVYAALMHEHYDPTYDRSMRRHFAGYDQAPRLRLDDGGPATLDAAAGELIRRAGDARLAASPRDDAGGA